MEQVSKRVTLRPRDNTFLSVFPCCPVPDDITDTLSYFFGTLLGDAEWLILPQS